MTTLSSLVSCLRQRFVVTCLVLALPVAAVAQSNGPDDVFDAAGAQANRDYFKQLDFEYIDTLSGGVVLSFTDVTLPGPPGLEVAFQRHYNSKTGWTYGLAGVPMWIEANPGDPPNLDPNLTPRSPSDWLPRLRMADGSIHWTAWQDNYETGTWSAYEKWRWTVSSQFWKFDRRTRTLYMSDGRIAQYDSSFLLSRIRTPFSPKDGTYEIRFTYAPRADGGTDTTITQQLGGTQTRSLVLIGGASGPTRLDVIAGSTRSWTYVGGALLTSVTPPAGRGWTFGYTTLAGNTTVLNSVQTPGGSVISYGYERHLFDRDMAAGAQPDVLDKILTSTVVTSRTVGGSEATSGTWTYSYEDAGAVNTTTVTHPDATRTIFTYGVIGASLIRVVPEPPPTGYPAGQYVNSYPTAAYGVIERRVHRGADPWWLERETRSYVDLPVTSFPGAENAASKVAELKTVTIERDGRTYTTVHDFAAGSGNLGNFNNYHQPAQTIEQGGGLSRTTTRAFDHATVVGLPDVAYIVGRVSAQTVSVGGESVSTSSSFDGAKGFQTSRTEAGITTSFEPAAGGFTGAAIDAHGHRTSYSYDWGVLRTTTTPHRVTSRVINPEGTVQSETVRGKTTTYTYDALSRVRFVQAPATQLTETRYDDTSGRAFTVLQGGWSSTTTFDGFGRELWTQGSDGVRTSRRYDAEGRVSFVSLPWMPANPTAFPEVGTTREYDSLGRIVSRLSPLVQPASTWRYDVADGGGPKVTFVDEKYRTTVASYQAFGHPSDARLRTLVDAKGTTWTYSYNALGRLTKVSAPGTPDRVWTYDDHNLLIQESHPESGVTHYAYDGAGRPTSRTDGRGTVFAYTRYDNEDRLLELEATTTDHTVQRTQFAFETDSTLQSRIVDGNVTTDFRYDDAGRVREREDNLRGRRFLTTYGYDLRGNLKTLKYRDGLELTYTYDPATNRLIRVENADPDPLKAKVYADNFQYHPSGAVSSVRIGDGATPTESSTQTLALDGRYRPQRIRSTRPGQTILDLDYYRYDKADNLERLYDNGRQLDFTYDDLDRLLTATGFAGLEYRYDAHGNRISVPGRSTYVYEPGTMRLVQQDSFAFGYDGGGNVTTYAAGTSYAYDASNRLTSATTPGGRATYEYDGQGQRAVRTVKGTTFLYVHDPAGQLLSEYVNHADRATPNRDYIYAGSRLIATVQPPERVVPPDLRVSLSVTSPAFEAPATIQLVADVVYPAGTTIQRVEFYRGVEKVGTDTSEPYAVDLTSVGAGNYTFTAKLITSSRSVFSSAVPVKVIAVGRPLGVIFSPDPAYDNEPVTLTIPALAPCGALGFDYGDNSEYVVDAVSTLPHVSPRTHTWTSPGTYTVTVYGHGDCRNSVTTTITVNARNPRPTATLTAPAAGASFFYGTPISLTANANDTNGSVVGVDFMDGATVIGSDSSAPYAVTWTNAPAGTRILTAVATDNQGAPGTSPPVTITVTYLSGVTVSPSSVAVNQPANVTVTGFASCSSVRIDYGDTQIQTLANGSLPTTVSHAWTSGGTKTVKARGQGPCDDNIDVTTTVTVTVNPPPMVALTSPANGGSAAAPASISLSATATDSDGIKRVEFYSGDTLIGTDMTAPYAMTWSGIDGGVYTFTARAVDMLDAPATSAPVTFTVRHMNTITVSPSTLVVGQTGDITVTGSAACGTVTINYGDTTFQTFAQAPPLTKQHVWAAAGTYTVTAIGEGAACNATGPIATTVTVTANTAPTVSLTAPAGGSVHTTATPITLSATASDSHGIDRVVFYAGSAPVGTDMTSPYSVTWANPASGSYSLTARAYDTYGAMTTSTAASITVRDVSGISVSPSTVVVGQKAYFTVTGSTSCQVLEINYGNGIVTYPISGLPVTTDRTWSTAGTMTVTATGTTGCTGTATTTVTVNANPGPMLSLTSPANGATYQATGAVPLSVSVSDPHGINRVEYYNGATLLATSTTSPYSATWSNVPAGSYSVTAKAYDAYGAVTTSAAAAITVNNGTVVGITVSTPRRQNAPLTVTATGTNPCGSVEINYGDGWVQTYALPQTGLPFTPQDPHVWTTGGTKTITVRGQGNCGGVVSTTIYVDWLPTVSITSPAAGSTFVAPASFTINAAASDTEGPVSKVDFYANGVLINTDTTSPFSFAWGPVPAANWTLTAVATDGGGGTKTSAPVAIAVNAAAPSTVTSISVTPSPTRVNQSTTVTIYGNNPCGAIQVNWGDGNAPVYPITSLPMTYYYAWATTGNKTITVTGMGNCSGTVSTTFAVNP